LGVHHWRHVHWREWLRLVSRRGTLSHPSLLMREANQAGSRCRCLVDTVIHHQVGLTKSLSLVKRVQLLRFWSKSQLLVVWWSDQRLGQVRVN
jgi:hypothetical protein